MSKRNKREWGLFINPKTGTFDYTTTKYTSDDGSIVKVTYGDSVSFIINYNSYAITVRLNGEVIPVDSYSYHDIVEEG